MLEKQVMLQPFVPLDNAHISAQSVSGHMNQPIKGHVAKVKPTNVFLPPPSCYHVITDS